MYHVRRYTDLVNGIVDAVAWAVRAGRISDDVSTLAIPHDVIGAGSAHAVESAQYLHHVTRRSAAEHYLRYPTATVEALACR